MKLNLLTTILVILFFQSCVNEDQFDPNTDTALYRVTFNSTWSSSTHPTNFPTNPHFSGLVGMTHTEDTTLWERGSFASSGLEVVAETGGKSVIFTEIDQKISEGSAGSRLSGAGITNSPGSVAISFTASRTFPLMSLVSMLAPSPDWFVGVNSLRLYDDEDGWVTNLEIPLRVYDAGTDSGTRFLSGDIDTNPADLVTRLTSSPTDTDFVRGENTIGSFVIERVE